ncbi:MAG: DNA repair protein RadA [Pseudomonadota bacterium]
MARPPKLKYVCENCGAETTKWVGKCPSCGEWNTLVEHANAAAAPGSGLNTNSKGRVVSLESLAGTTDDAPRLETGNRELDRVTGGGIVPGSATLIGGEPGIGKSTILLQLSAKLANAGRRVLYFSGEEATAQIRLRAERLGVTDAPVGLAAETNLSDILATIEDGPVPDLVIIDSIQTLWADAVDSAPGSVTQVRAATQSLIRHTKARGAGLILVGHVTKEGQIAGPKMIEHMVDTVLYFEGDRGQTYRLLRAVKNRFGPADEIGVFEMAETGLRMVRNPSELFLGDRDPESPGAAVFAGMEGTRPVLIEIQALVAPSALGTPRRSVVGWDSNRLSMLLAVLAARCGLSFAQHDVFLNVAGGIKISEPAADLAAAAALISSLSNKPLPTHAVTFGEISLSGAVRACAQMPVRLKEAQKLGFETAFVPAAGDLGKDVRALDLRRLSHLKALAGQIGPCD